jgi:hypothetical protein
MAANDSVSAFAVKQPIFSVGTEPAMGPSMNAQQYETTRRFTGGTLDGLTYTETVRYYTKPGLVVSHPIGGSPYEIVSCIPVAQPTESL